MIRFQLLHPAARLPTRNTTGAVGYDLHACEAVVIPGQSAMRVRTGVAIELPARKAIRLDDDLGVLGLRASTEAAFIEAQVRGRSGLAFKHQVLAHHGTIDPDYRGEVGVMLFNFGVDPYTVQIGDRVAQLVFAVALVPRIVEADELTPTARGTNGFGSTGR